MSEVILRNIAETFVNLNAIDQTRSWMQPRVDGVKLYAIEQTQL